MRGMRRIAPSPPCAFPSITVVVMVFGRRIALIHGRVPRQACAGRMAERWPSGMVASVEAFQHAETRFGIELTAHEYDDDADRRHYEQIRTGEPAEIADRQEDGAQPLVEMLCRKNVHADHLVGGKIGAGR